MAAKNKRGSGTHGSGSRNTRGAGNRGGRGASGSKSHEHHKVESLGKSGFTRPNVREVATVTLQEISEYVFYEKIQTDEQIKKVDARSLTDENEKEVKILASGKLNESLTIVADEFSEAAVEAIKSNGGSVVRRSRKSDAKPNKTVTNAGEPVKLKEAFSEVSTQELESVDGEQPLGRLYNDLCYELDFIISHSVINNSTPRQRVVYSLVLAGLFLPVVDRPVGYITVTGVIYAIMSDMARYQEQRN